MSLIDQIKEHEGFRSRVYQCTEGHDTIGFGFKIADELATLPTIRDKYFGGRGR